MIATLTCFLAVHLGMMQITFATKLARGVMVTTRMGELGEVGPLRRDREKTTEYLLELLELLRREVVQRSGGIDVDVTGVIGVIVVHVAVAVADADGPTT